LTYLKDDRYWIPFAAFLALVGVVSWLGPKNFWKHPRARTVSALLAAFLLILFLMVTWNLQVGAGLLSFIGRVHSFALALGGMDLASVHFVRYIGILSFAVVAIGIWMSFPPFPVIRISYAGSVQEIDDLLEQDGAREKARTAVEKDFFFLSAYWLLFLALSFLLARRHSNLALAGAALGAVFGTGTAVYDILENLRLLQLLEAKKISDSLRKTVRRSAGYKFSLLSISLALLGFAVPVKDCWALLFCGFLATAVVSLLGSKFRFFAMLAIGMSFAIILTAAILFTFFPTNFVQAFQ